MMISNFVVSIRSTVRKDRIDMDFFRDVSVTETDPGKNIQTLCQGPEYCSGAPQPLDPQRGGSDPGKVACPENQLRIWNGYRHK